MKWEYAVKLDYIFKNIKNKYKILNGIEKGIKIQIGNKIGICNLIEKNSVASLNNSVCV